MKLKIVSYDQIDSTNRVAKELVMEGYPSGTVVRAASQSAGRGQYGRSFSSPLGGLYFSLLLEPDLPIDALPLVTLATGLACRNVIHQMYGINLHIKWPNDLYLNGQKLAGILCEHVVTTRPTGTVSAVIIGVGINADSKREDFDEELQPIVTTLRDHFEGTIDLEQLLIRLVQAIIQHAERLRYERAALLAEWQEADYLLQKSVVYTREGYRLQGIGQGVTPQGLYRILDENGTEQAVIGGQLRPAD